MKKIMILGAGTYQLPLILKAREMGIFTIVCSIPGNYPGFFVADQVYYADTTDCSTILKIARRERIDGICTTGTDVAVRSVGYVCEKMSLSGVSYSAAVRATDKLEMKKAFKEHAVNTAAFAVVNNMKELEAAIGTFAKPVILKVTDKSGSRGIVKIQDESHLKNAYEYCRGVSAQKPLLLEEFIDAEEIGVDGFVVGGKVVLYLPHKKKIISNGKTNIPLGHEFPFIMSDTQTRNLRKTIEQAIAVLGIDHCAFNADVFVRENQVYIIEIGARCGATGIPELISKYCGFDYYEKMLLTALGESVDFTVQQGNPCISHLLFSAKSGKVSTIYCPQITGIEVTLDIKEGDYVEKIKDGTSRYGQIIASGGTLEEAKQRLEEFLRGYCIVVQE